MASAVQILVVDDEAEMREAICEYLNLRGFSVSTAANGREMRLAFDQTNFDLVLLDLGLPGEDGIALTRELRASSQVGIIIITAFGESEDRVLGLESGADDYVVKPFSLRELLARVRSLLRRAEANGHLTSTSLGTKCVRIGENNYDRGTRELRRDDGTLVTLSAGECDLLELFLDNPDRPLSRDELVEQTAHRAWEPLDRSIDVRINRLRRTIEEDSSHPRLIKTVRGIGYLYKSNL